ncbi:MAG: ABC transporter ATP-binding protein [Hyphomicrobiales bacterium]|nr:ABC transporter ATP-binding protein [Hyphomicrobiales bacterium]
MSDNGVSLKITGLRKSWGQVEVLKGIDLEIEAGAFLTLLGPSGCGKSTALRLIAGLDAVGAGSIVIDGVDVTAIPPTQRNIGMVFQNYALFPHMSVRDNILYGLRVRRHSKADQATRLKRVAAFMNLEPLLDRRPGQLSGGQQQRVALARVLISERKLVLMDEPLSNLDAKLRAEIRTEIKELNHKLGITVVYVTHDQSEALSMSDKVLLMEAGETVQFGAPVELYNEPASIGAARFIGTPPMNVIAAAHLPDYLEGLGLGSQDDDFRLGIRPEHMHLTDEPTDLAFPATVTDTEYEGSQTLVRLATALGETVMVTLPSKTTPKEGAGVSVGCEPSAIRLFRTSDGKALLNDTHVIGSPAPVVQQN